MTPNNTKRLLRTPDGIIAGVCGGLAEFFGLDAVSYTHLTLPTT